MSTPVESVKGSAAKGCVLIILFAIATVLIAAATYAGWLGGFGFFLILIFGGVVIFATHGLITGGAAGRISCPECGNQRRIKGVRMKRYHRCSSCKTWSVGTESMAVIEPDHVAPSPLFTAVVTSETIAWPTKCPACMRPSTRDIKVSGTTALAPAIAALSPVSVASVATVKVPHCDQHKDGVELEVVRRGVELRFRSMAYWREFVDANEAAVPGRGEIWPPQAEWN